MKNEYLNIKQIKGINVEKSQEVFLEKYKNYKLIKDLKINDQEMLVHSSIIKKAIDSYYDCLKQEVNCPNGGFHYVLYRDQNNELKSKIEECQKIKGQNQFRKITDNYALKEITVVDYELKKETFQHYLPKLEEIKNNFYKKNNTYIQVINDDAVDAISGLTNELCFEDNNVAFINIVDFSTHTITNPLEKLSATLEQLRSVDLLVINELGVEKFSRYFNINLLYTVINYRYVIKKPTILISKYDLKELLKKYTMSTPTTQKKDIENFINKIKSTTKKNIIM